MCNLFESDMSQKSKTKGQDVDAIAEALLAKLEPRLAQIQHVGEHNERKLTAIHQQLATLTANLNAVTSEVDNLKATAQSNSETLDEQARSLRDLEEKMAEMEDRSRRCNIRIIGLAEGLEGSNAVQYLTHSLTTWFPKLADDGIGIEIMRAHRIYRNATEESDTAPRTLIFNVLRFTSRQAILRAARGVELKVGERVVRFTADYSNYTVKRRQAFRNAMDSARNKGLEFFLLYPAILKIREGGRFRSFTSARQAEDFVRKRRAPSPLLLEEEAPASEEDASDAAGNVQDDD